MKRRCGRRGDRPHGPALPCIRREVESIKIQKRNQPVNKEDDFYGWICVKTVQTL